MKVIAVKELFSNAFSQKQALILRAEIQKLLDEEEKIIIDFKHVSNCTVLFFNFSTGYFISLLGVEKYNEKIALKGLSQSGELSYKSSCKVAAERYNPKIQNEILSIISNPDEQERGCVFMFDDIGTRMKTYYEQISKTNLMRRTPVAIRIDGKSFHTFTKGFEKPFDSTLMSAMQATMQYLCENIQGCVLGYTQSDEITLILIDYQKLNSSAWFDYEVQKLCSISASMATMAFNRYFREIATTSEMYQVYSKVFDKAMFDARCFNIPKEEVANLLYWRQLDATRNSILAVGQKYFSNKQLHGKSCNAIQDMLLTQRDINWNDYSIPEKRGSCCIKDVNSKWFIDDEIPIFKNEGRDYIERLIYFDEE